MIVDQTKFILGIVFGVAGIAILLLSRGSRGFDQRRQAGALFLVAAVVFAGIGLGYLDL